MVNSTLKHRVVQKHTSSADYPRIQEDCVSIKRCNQAPPRTPPPFINPPRDMIVTFNSNSYNMSS